MNRNCLLRMVDAAQATSLQPLTACPQATAMRPGSAECAPKERLPAGCPVSYSLSPNRVNVAAGPRADNESRFVYTRSPRLPWRSLRQHQVFGFFFYNAQFRRTHPTMGEALRVGVFLFIFSFLLYRFRLLSGRRRRQWSRPRPEAARASLTTAAESDGTRHRRSMQAGVLASVKR